jgi:hydroxymethylpyrimidine/phosphomethylpyrimidine kinase
VAESGAPLLEPDAKHALVELLALATVITPNMLEARALVDESSTRGAETAADLAAALRRLGPPNVVLTGGHGESAEATDFFWDGEHAVEIPGPRYPGRAAHGSGCTHSSALAAHLALGLDPLEAAVAAKRVASEAVRDALTDVGAGPGPVDALGIAARRAAVGPLA